MYSNRTYGDAMQSKSTFFKVKCKKCRNEQILFNKAALTVKCLVCEDILAESRGGHALIHGQVLESLR